MNLDLRIASDSDEAKRAVEYAGHTVRVGLVILRYNRAALPNVNAAV